MSESTGRIVECLVRKGSIPDTLKDREYARELVASISRKRVRMMVRRELENMLVVSKCTRVLSLSEA